jgi:AraC-like DNA-binding protein
MKSWYMDPHISPEQFIAEHTLMYVLKGAVHVYDGSNHYTFSAGEYGLGRKNHLARYTKEKINDELEKVFIFFDEPFLKMFEQKHKPTFRKFKSSDVLVRLKEDNLVHVFIRSLLPYYAQGKIDTPFSDIKREELLIILLRQQPELTGIFFDFARPQKIDIQAFMVKNYKFNISIERIAYLTGRSISAFKRDFKQVFNDTPSHWLVQRRLQEAYFLLEKKRMKPIDIYYDLGFENLSHFSYAFKKKFGLPPTEMGKK